jgi:hypothetical protein
MFPQCVQTGIRNPHLRYTASWLVAAILTLQALTAAHAIGSRHRESSTKMECLRSKNRGRNIRARPFPYPSNEAILNWSNNFLWSDPLLQRRFRLAFFA